ncbi:MAG: DUF5060 domain-containing protein [Planctomycetota bacterium]|jgi:hypothetical protein
MKRLLSAAQSIRLGLLAVVLSPQIGIAQQEIPVEVSRQRVGKYEKVEFLIRVETQYGNPFDPEEVDLSVVLNAPDGKRLSLPAFYCQQYERRPVDREGRRGQASWMYPVGKPAWKARFAPMQVGGYRAAAILKDRGGTRRSRGVEFLCTQSGRKGFVRVSKKDPRFFELSEGQPLFAIGQNLAFIGEGQYVNLSKAEEIFEALARNGANYLRIWTCCKDWAMAVEARKSAWGRSWNWKPPIVPVPDGKGTERDRKCLKLAGGDGSALAVSPSHAVALRPNTRYVFSARIKTEENTRVRVDVGSSRLEDAVSSGTGQKWTPFSHEFQTGPSEFWLGRTAFRLEGQGTAWLSDLSLKEAAGGPELLWEADVNRRIRGYYNPVDCFMLDEIVEAARGRGIYLQLCLITRDLYMGSLKDPSSPEYQEAIDDAKKLLRYAVARWGSSTGVAAWEYFNEIDPNLPTDRFYTELGEYLERIDPYGHLRTTSTWHPSARDCRHQKLDIADVHFYLRPADKTRLGDEVEAVLDRVRFLRQHAPDKPAHLGEFGLANERWQPTTEMNQSDQVVDFHNAIWASALSGSSGTALFWWWDRLDKRNHYPHYRPLAEFLVDVPWTTAGLHQAAATVSDKRVRTVGLQGRDRAYVWLFNPQAAWSSAVMQNVTPTPISGATLEVKDLAPGTYRVQWWDTRQGKTVKEEERSPSAALLRLAVPTFARDIACKIVP